MTSYLLIILVISITFGLFFFSTAKSHLEQEVGRKLQDIASIAAKNAPFERLELIKIGDEQTRMVLRLKEKLNEIREATGVENIFVFRPDRTSLLDLQPEKAIGSTYLLRHFDEKFIADLKENKAVSSGSYQRPTGSLFISAYAPVLDPDNRLFAIVGVDAGSREVEVLEKLRARLYWITGLGVVLAFSLALLLAKTLTRPIKNMAVTAQRLGQGDYQARVALPATNELHVLANSINMMAEQVQRRDASLKEMTASVAHEIKNPLNSINLLITLMGEELEEKNGAPPPKELETVHYEIRKLNRFLTEFLTYSRPVTLVQDDISPLELVQGAMDMAKAEAEEKGVKIIVTSQPDLPTITVDRQRMEQSLLNILQNAVASCDQGGSVLLKVGRSGDGNFVEFAVEDSGHGIPPAIMDKLFEPFFTTRDSGTGLGLSNARKIVKSHNGVIFAQNNPKGGATFVFRIPLIKE